MDKFLKYSVFQYAPYSCPRKAINLGVIFYEEELNYREFRFCDNFSCISKFDDEIDADIVEKLMRGIKEDVEGEMYSLKTFDIDEYIRYYINDFCFERTKTIKYEKLEETIESVCGTCFR